jgi:hypothetical protein
MTRPLRRCLTPGCQGLTTYQYCRRCEQTRRPPDPDDEPSR